MATVVAYGKTTRVAMQRQWAPKVFGGDTDFRRGNAGTDGVDNADTNVNERDDTEGVDIGDCYKPRWQ